MNNTGNTHPYKKIIIFNICNRKDQKLGHRPLYVCDPGIYEDTINSIECPCEYFGLEGQQSKAVFDTDNYEPINQAYNEKAKVKDLKNRIKDILDLNNTDSIYMIHRECRPEVHNGENCLKYSYHFIVDGTRITCHTLKALLESKGYTDSSIFDLKIYVKNAGIYPIYTNNKYNDEKGIYNVGMLKPYGVDNDDIDISKYCVSYIEDTFEDYDAKYSHLVKPKVNKSKPTIVSMLFKNAQISTDDNNLIGALVGCLKKERADDYEQWMKLGWALHNIDTDLLTVWDNFSKFGSTYKEGECERLWFKMKKQDLGLPTLKYWAKLDDPQKYKKIIEDSISTYIDTAIRSDGTDYDVASVIAKYKKDEIVYDKKTYFVVDERNVWKQKDDKFITSLCGNEICRLFITRSLYYTSLNEGATETQKILYDEMFKKCLKIAQKLKTSSYVDSLKKQLPALLQADDFLETKLDCNINLFAFNNSVFDLEQNIIRKIEPTDYISITTGYDYNPDVDESIVQEVQDLLDSYFATDEMRQYVLNVLTSLLYGKNKYQEFYIFTGVGCNGKSFLQRFVDLAFGNYASKVNATTFTKASKGANENTEMYDAKGKRYIYFEEPESDDKLITGRLKEYSGDTKLKTKGLYRDPVSWMPQFKMFGACNDIPQLSKADNAIQRRLRIVKFPFVFKENPQCDREKALNKEIAVKIDDDICYRQAFIKILIENWMNIKNLKQLPTPTEVMIASKEHIDCSNVVLEFVDRFYIYKDVDFTEEDKKELLKDKCGDLKIKSRDLYNEFKRNYPKENVAENVFASRLNDIGINREEIHKISYRLRIRAKTIDELYG